MKVYVFTNLDGDNAAMVAAQNFKAACQAVGCSRYDAKNYGWRRANESEAAEIQRCPPGTILYRPLSLKGEWGALKARQRKSQ